MTYRPGWRRRRRYEWAFSAPRCSWCGWSLSVVGRHDPRYVGHGDRCPVKLFGSLTTAEEIADQWRLLEAWARACARLGDVLDWQSAWLDMSWSLSQRAMMLGVDLPTPDDAAALAPV